MDAIAPTKLLMGVRLPKRRGAGGDDVEAGDDRRLQEAGALGRHGAEPDELGQRVRAEHESSDVHGPVAAGDVGMTTCSREPSARVASTNGQVDAAAAGPQHDLDQVVDLLLGEHGEW
jgi:hypothetical protein